MLYRGDKEPSPVCRRDYKMYIYDKVITDMIEKEKQGKSFRYNKHDKIILKDMLSPDYPRHQNRKPPRR